MPSIDLPGSAGIPPAILAAARRVLAYLAATDPLPPQPADAVLGFGVFDLELPRFCGELHLRGLAARIVFTGGLGAGTGMLGAPEADAWRAELRRVYPEIPDNIVILENRSTNTAENIRFTADLLARDHPSLTFEAGLRTAIIVASPSRLRRVQLTLRHLHPALRTYRQLPPFTFERELALYTQNNVNYLAHLVGELDRLIDYPARGWIASEPLPSEISAAHAELRHALSSGEAARLS